MTTFPNGAPCWIDLLTSDPERSRAFYTQLFGWTAQPAAEEYGGYWQFTLGDAPVGGGMPNSGEAGMPDTWSIYLCTDDAEKTIEAAEAGGGRTLLTPMPVGELGTMAMVTDPAGAAIGLWQPRGFAGLGAVYESGAPGWFELHTRDYEACVAFYRDVMRWDARRVSDTPEFRYTIAMDGERQLAGIMDASAFLPDGVPAHWSVYVAVDDVEATLAATARLGGTVVRPAEDTPYGRLATASDPTGAQFKLVGGSTPAA